MNHASPAPSLVILECLRACSLLQPAWDAHLQSWDGEERGDYNDIGVVADFVVGCFERGQTDALSKIFFVAEDFLHKGDETQKGLVIVGLLEGIQNISSHRPFGADVFIPYLGASTKGAWEELNRAWQGKHSLGDIVRAKLTGKK